MGCIFSQLLVLWGANLGNFTKDLNKKLDAVKVNVTAKKTIMAALAVCDNQTN